MKIKNLVEGLNAQQRSVPQLPAQAQARKISVLGAKTDPKHPFAGYMVGADESVAEGKPQKRADRYHINKDGKPASLASYADRDSAVKDRDAKYPDAKVHQVGPRGKVKGEFEEGMAEGKWNYPPEYTKKANADDEAELGVSLINKDARKAWRKKQKARAHKDLMTGKKKEPGEFEGELDSKDRFTKDTVQKMFGKLSPNAKGVAENWGEPLTGWHVVYARTGNKVSGTPDFDSRDSAQKYLMTKMSANHHNYRVAHADNLGTSAPTPMGGYLESKGVAETTSDPKFDKMLKGITGKKAVAKQQKTDTKQQTRDAFGSMFGGTSADLLKNLKIREQGAAEERNELDTPAVQAALAKMAERHRGEKWSKEQLAALGKRIAARGQKPVKEDDVADFLARGGKITQVKPNRGPRNPGLSLGSRHIGGGGDGARASRTGRGSKPQGKPVVAVETDVDEGLKSKLAGAVVAGAAALGGGAAAAHDHGDYGHYDQRLDDRNWDTAGYDDHIKSDTKLTKTTTPDGKVSRDSQDRISSVQGPNAQGEYRVFVGLNGKIISSYITKTPPQNWMVKEGVTKEDIITKLKARLGDYLSDIGQEIRKDPALIDKLSAKTPGDQMGPPVKTITTDDGHQISIHGNEDDGFRISIKNKSAATKFKNLDEAVMACEMYCARRRTQALNADYVEEA
jgi:hypothetical protein